MSSVVFNAPPGWPSPPPGWLPPMEWRPPAHWPAPPPGWSMFLELPRALREGETVGPRGVHGPPAPVAGGTGPFDPAYSRPSRALPRRGAGTARWLRRWRWPLRVSAAFLVLLAFLMVGSALNTPAVRAMAACEGAAADKVTAAEPGSTQALARPEVRYVVTPGAPAGTVSIGGDYLSPTGGWGTFTCTARYDIEPVQVVSVAIQPNGVAAPMTTP